jgi:hypothetical protein
LASVNEEVYLPAVRALLLNRCTGGPAPRPFEEIAGIPWKRRTRQRIKADGGVAPFAAQ